MTGSRRRLLLTLSFGTATALVCGLLYVGVSLWPAEASREEVKQAMAPLVEAIQRFQNQNQRLPKSLDELVPGFLPRLPAVPRGGTQWEYEGWGTDTKNFSVTLKQRREIIDYRSDLPGGWFYRDSSF